MENDLATQIETIFSDISSGEYGQAAIDSAPLLVAIGGFAKGLGFAAKPMTEEEHKKSFSTLKKCIDLCDTKAKENKATPVGKIGDGAILKALQNLLQFALEIWPLIAPFIPLGPTPPAPAPAPAA